MLCETFLKGITDYLKIRTLFLNRFQNCGYPRLNFLAKDIDLLRDQLRARRGKVKIATSQSRPEQESLPTVFFKTPMHCF